MKHKLFTFLIAVMANLGTMFAESGTCGDNLTWNLTDGVLTISGTGAMADYEYVDGGFSSAPWNDYREKISSLEFQLGVTSIGKYAFYQCRHLTTVTLPSSVISIGRNAFDGCANLISATIPNSVTTIGWYAFSACTNLSSVTIPESVTELGIWPFQHCSGLTSIDVASTNPKYSSTNGVLFYKTESSLLKYPAGKPSASYIIPDNTTSISDYAFEGSTHLTSVTIPNSVTDIRSYAFRNCENLASLTIPNSVTRIGGYAFLYCTGLTSVICKAITPPTIESTAFYGVDISIPLYVPAQSLAAYKAADVWKDFGTILPIEEDTRVLSIAEAINVGMALDSMATSAETYTIEGYVINAGVFSSQFKYQNWYMADDLNATSSDFQAYRCYPIDGTDTVEVHNGSKVRMIGKLQKYYDRIKSVYVVEMKSTPATILTKIQLDTITVAQALEIGATLAENASTAKQYVIRGYVTSITTPFDEQYGNQTFYIADDINSTADSYATGGFQVYRGKPVTGKAIAVGALVELTTAIKNYRGIIIESTETNVPVTVLEEGPECRILSGTCGENLTWTLNTCDSVLAISGTGVMYNYSKQNVAPWAYLGVKSAVIGNGVTTLGTFAFYQCAMSSISIPASVTKVHFNTFNNSYNLMNFTVDSANPVYSSLDGVLFNKDQTIIVRYPRGRQGEYAIPEGVVIVGDGAFNGCYNVTDVKIPNSVTTLGMAAFFACGMAEITIPENVNRIDSLAFIGCQHLKVVTNYAIEPQVIDTNVFGGVIDISECTLYVPAQSLAAYQTADVWKDFGNILPIEDTPSHEIDRTGTCGDNMALTWTYDPGTKTLTISGNGTLNSNYTFGPEAPAEIEQLIIAEGVTSIGDSAFRNMSTLQTMQLPSSLKTIGAKAFENCIDLSSIYNYRERPCLVDATAFNGVNKFDCTLYVLEGSVDMYKSSISDWKDFYFILPIGTTEVTEPVSDVTVEPHDNSATVTWPTNDNAASYTIEITKDGVVFCTLIFNANGQLTGIAFAPSRDGSHHAPAAIMTANGLQFTVTGLNSNTKYSYSVTAKDGNDVPVATYSGEFTTTSEGIATAVDNTSADSKATKLLLNGQIFILRGEKEYTIMGQEVK